MYSRTPLLVCGLLCSAVHSFLIPKPFLPVLMTQYPLNGVMIDSVSNLYKDIEENRIGELIINQDLNSVLSITTENEAKQIMIHPIEAQPIVGKGLDHNVPITISSPSSNIVGKIISFLSPFVLWGLFYFFITSFFVNNIQNNGGGGFLMKDKVYSTVSETPNVNLTDWAGSPEIFHECYEVVSYLKDNEKFQEIGARVPKGVLLEGPPGTGKTLLAKAIASETGATFFPTVASEFVELFVGMGAKRIRSLFEEARKNKPAIIFIDEIDAIGKSRTSISVTGNEEREQALNQLLSEMDGFTSNDQILVIAATNRKDTLDTALLRPGRFDRVIPVPLPDIDSRLAILNVHLDNKKVSTNVTSEVLEYIAENTEGLSGADLSNIVNEGLILAVRNNRTSIEPEDLFHSVEKLTVGIIKNLDSRSYLTKRRTAIHEIGHALAVLLFPDYRLEKVSIRPTYSGAGGYTIYSPITRDEGLYSRDDLLQKITILLGGKVAETLFYGENGVSTGAVYDLQQANMLVDQMIRQFGMGNKNPNYFDYTGEYSEKRFTQLEDEAQEIMDEAFLQLYDAISLYQERIDELVPILIQKNTITGEEFEDFFQKLIPPNTME